MFQSLLKFIINFGFSPRQLVYVSFVKSLPTKLSDFNVGLLHHIYSNAQNNPTPIIPLKQSFFSFSSVTHRIPHGGAYMSLCKHLRISKRRNEIWKQCPVIHSRPSFDFLNLLVDQIRELWVFKCEH